MAMLFLVPRLFVVSRSEATQTRLTRTPAEPPPVGVRTLAFLKKDNLRSSVDGDEPARPRLKVFLNRSGRAVGAIGCRPR